MNRKLIVRILGALMMIEAAAMIPALIISLIYRDGDTMALVYSILLVLSAGALMTFLPKTGSF